MITYNEDEKKIIKNFLKEKINIIKNELDNIGEAKFVNINDISDIIDYRNKLNNLVVLEDLYKNL